MKAAIVWSAGKIPVYGDFNEPVPAEGESLIKVSAAALSPLVKGRASGAHYSAGREFPFVAGVDGVGRLEDGRRVYFLMPRAPFGSMAEMAASPSSQYLLLPDGLNDVTAAAIANPGMSSWAALKERAKLAAGETVLINGATGTAGRLAIQIARHLHAGRVIATGRNVEVLNSLGADATIPLVEDADALETAFKEQLVAGVDVAIDYVWGRSAERLLIAAAKVGRETSPFRFVQVGSTGGSDITLPSAVLRSFPIEMIGSGLGSVPAERLIAAIGEVLGAAASGELTIATKAVPLSEVEQSWSKADGAARVVFTTGMS
jgi:NADPH:quinone reductase-like Zn-dependent oxidoreductase